MYLPAKKKATIKHTLSELPYVRFWNDDKQDDDVLLLYNVCMFGIKTSKLTLKSNTNALLTRIKKYYSSKTKVNYLLYDHKYFKWFIK